MDTDIPPSYNELGKRAHDLFTQGYHFDYWRFDCKTKSQSGVELITCGQSSPLQRKIFGAFAIKHKVQSHDITLTEKWCPLNTVIGKLETQANNFKLVLEGTCNYKTGYKTRTIDELVYQCDNNTKVAVSYAIPTVKTDVDFNLTSSRVRVIASIVFALGNVYAGCQTTTKGLSTDLNRISFALSYHNSDGDVLHAAMNTDSVREKTDYTVSFVKHCSENLDLGVKVSWTSTVSNSKIGVSIRKHLFAGDVFRATIKSCRQIGVGYQVAVLNGFNMFFSVLFDSKNEKTQFGYAVEFEA